MAKKNVLVRFGNHTRHMAFWLEGHGLGQRDAHDRGVWVAPTTATLAKVEAAMRAACPRNATTDRWNLWVEINTHNQLTFSEVAEVLCPDLWSQHRAAVEAERMEQWKARRAEEEERDRRRKAEREAEEARKAEEAARAEEERKRAEAEEAAREAEMEEHSRHLSALLAKWM